MEIEEDDHVLLITGNRLKDPVEDPLGLDEYAVHGSNKHSGEKINDNIINLDSSDDETCIDRKRKQESTTKINSNASTIPQRDIINLEAEDSDPLAPLRTFINATQDKNMSYPTTHMIKKSIYSKTSKAVKHIPKNSSEVPVVNSSIQGLKNIHLDLHSKTSVQIKRVKCFPGDKNTVSKTTKRPSTCPKSSKKIKVAVIAQPDVKLADKSFNNMCSRVLKAVEKIKRSSDFPKNKMNIVSNTTKKLEVANKANISNAVEVPEKHNLTYLGKIIDIPGHPSLIEDPSGLVFRADNRLSNLKNAGSENNLEAEMNLYSHFFNDPANTNSIAVAGQNIPNHTQKIFTTGFFTQKSNTSVDKIPESGTSDSKLVLHKKTTFSPKTGGIKLKNQLIKNNLSDTCNIFVKKPELLMAKSENIKEPTEKQHAPILIPYQPKESNSTVLDLNLNINGTRSLCATRPRENMSQSQNTLSLPNETPGSYNFALGLVLNVNDLNQANNCSPKTSSNQFTSLNNVALDLHFNVNNKEEPTKVTDQQISQNALLLTPLEPNIPKDALKLVNNTVGHTYCCYLCSFKTADIKIIKSHVCPLSSANSLPQRINSSLKEPIQISVNKNEDLERLYCCVACSFQTTEFEVMNSHICALVNTALPNKVNLCFEKPNLEQVENSMETEIHGGNTTKKIYNCVACSFQTADLTVVQSHKCAVSKQKSPRRNKTGKKNTSDLKNMFKIEMHQNKISMEKLYSCVSCSFKTAAMELVQSHRCQENILEYNKMPYGQNNEKLNILQPTEAPVMQSGLVKELLEKTTFTCEMCSMIFKTKHLLLQHLRSIPFGFHRKIGCYLCYSYFVRVKDLINHLELIHRVTSRKLINKEGYKCDACDFYTENLQDVKIHFVEHMETYQFKMLSRRSHLQDDLHEPQKSNEKSLYQCNYCGRKTDSISIWLTHVCQEQKEWNTCLGQKEGNTSRGQDSFLDVDANGIIYTQERRCTKSKALCYYCKRQIYANALRCDNSECENVYHLKCVEIYGQFMDPEEVSVPNWFCLECNNKKIYILPDAQDDIDNINWCLDFTDNECLKEIEKQKSITQDLQKIKEEKLTMKQEFQQIKKFITDSKSERINNNLVKSVCTIVESFINAGVDSKD